MTKSRIEFGEWNVHEPKKVVKLGFVMDEYKSPFAKQLWDEAEAKALSLMPLFKKDDLFFEESTPGKPGLVYYFRYYTPEANRVLRKESGQ